MENETNQEQSVSSINEVKKNRVIRKLFNFLVAYKVVLFSALIVIILSVLWINMTSDSGNTKNTSLTMLPDVTADKEQKTKMLAATRNEHASIKSLLESISSRIDNRTSVQTENSEFVKSELQGLAASIDQLTEMMTGLEVSNKDLFGQISESISGLNNISKKVQAIKATKHKPIASKKKHPVKKPPFVIDAIDVWDNVGYVAISQSGHTSFLKVGDQQSGWTLADIDPVKGQVSFQSAAGNIYSMSMPGVK